MRNLMEITKLYTIFPVFEDEKALLSSFDASEHKALNKREPDFARS
jgi:hypothetical protein